MASIVGYLVKVQPDRDSLGNDGHDADGVPSTRVLLTREALESVGGVVYRPGQDWTMTLQVLAVGDDGLQTPVEWPAATKGQLRVTNVATGELVLTRSTGTTGPVELTLTEGLATAVIRFTESEAAVVAGIAPGVHAMELLIKASSFLEPVILGQFEVGRLRVTGGDAFPS